MTPAELSQWLSTHAPNDRVIRTAVAAKGLYDVVVEAPGWWGTVRSGSGAEYRVVIVADPVGLPVRWYRTNEVRLFELGEKEGRK